MPLLAQEEKAHLNIPLSGFVTVVNAQSTVQPTLSFIASAAASAVFFIPLLVALNFDPIVLPNESTASRSALALISCFLLFNS